MSAHLQREIGKLKQQVFSLCAIVEDQVQMAVRAVLERDRAVAEGVERRDLDIDHQEVVIEEDCLKTLALYQPVAIDLRLIVTVLKMNNDLERIGDLAVTIARQGAALAEEPPIEIPFDLTGMWSMVQAMLRDALDSLVNMNAALAIDVCSRDDAVDQVKRDFRLRAEDIVRRDITQLSGMLRLLAVSRALERIADLATNIAEDVIYMIRGKIVRHGEGE